MKKFLICLFLVLGLVAALGQSGGRFIAQWQNSGTLIGTFTSYLRMNCSTGMSCSYSGGTVTLTASGTATNTGTAVPVAASPAISYTGMTLWLSADCITLSNASTCAVPSNGSTFNVWYDRSGNSKSAYRTAGTLTFNTAQINSQPAVTPSATPTLKAPAQLWTGAITVFAVFKNTGGAKAGLVANNSGFYWATGTTKEQVLDQSGTGSLGTGTAALDANWHQANVTCSEASNPTFRLDRAADATIGGAACALDNQSGTTYFQLLANFGGTEQLTGQIAELIMYNRVLSSAEITAVETYLNMKYAV